MTRLVYCDDQQRFRDAFQTTHRDHYDITLVSDVGDLLPTLDSLKTLPDLVLLDLYHPKGDPATQKQRSRRAEEQLAALDESLNTVRAAVLEAWAPSGLQALRLLRQKYPATCLPIALFTQKGLLLLEPNELREAELSAAEWLLKNRLDPITERLSIDRIVFEARRRQSVAAIPRLRVFLVISWLVLGALAPTLFFKGSTLVDYVAKVIGAALGAGCALLVSRLLAPKAGQ